VYFFSFGWCYSTDTSFSTKSADQDRNKSEVNNTASNVAPASPPAPTGKNVKAARDNSCGAPDQKEAGEEGEDDEQSGYVQDINGAPAPRPQDHAEMKQATSKMIPVNFAEDVLHLRYYNDVVQDSITGGVQDDGLVVLEDGQTVVVRAEPEDQPVEMDQDEIRSVQPLITSMMSSVTTSTLGRKTEEEDEENDRENKALEELRLMREEMERIRQQRDMLLQEKFAQEARAVEGTVEVQPSASGRSAEPGSRNKASAKEVNDESAKEAQSTLVSGNSTKAASRNGSEDNWCPVSHKKNKKKRSSTTQANTSEIKGVNSGGPTSTTTTAIQHRQKADVKEQAEPPRVDERKQSRDRIATASTVDFAMTGLSSLVSKMSGIQENELHDEDGVDQLETAAPTLTSTSFQERRKTSSFSQVDHGGTIIETRTTAPKNRAENKTKIVVDQVSVEVQDPILTPLHVVPLPPYPAPPGPWDADADQEVLCAGEEHQPAGPPPMLFPPPKASFDE
ncbi:unnamed protein product, partial [Amoebophrya sp. A120]